MSDTEVHQLVITYLFPALVIFTGAVAYFFGIRPALKQNPAFAHLYATEDTALNAIAAKLSGVKQKLTTIVLSATAFIVFAYDQIAPLAQEVGINVDPTKFLPEVPAYVWPLVSIVALWLLQYFRQLADKQARANAEALLNAGHPLAAPAPGLPINTLPSPSPLASLPDKAD